MLAPISESYLRHLLAEAGIPVDAPFGGVRQKNFDELEQSLLDGGCIPERKCSR